MSESRHWWWRSCEEWGWRSGRMWCGAGLLMSTVGGPLGAECDEDWRRMGCMRVTSIRLIWQLTATALNLDSNEMIDWLMGVVAKYDGFNWKSETANANWLNRRGKWEGGPARDHLSYVSVPPETVTVSRSKTDWERLRSDPVMQLPYLSLWWKHVRHALRQHLVRKCVHSQGKGIIHPLCLDTNSVSLCQQNQCQSCSYHGA